MIKKSSLQEEVAKLVEDDLTLWQIDLSNEEPTKKRVIEVIGAKITEVDRVQTYLAKHRHTLEATISLFAVLKME